MIRADLVKRILALFLCIFLIITQINTQLKINCVYADLIISEFLTIQEVSPDDAQDNNPPLPPESTNFDSLEESLAVTNPLSVAMPEIDSTPVVISNKKLTQWYEGNQWRDTQIADINGDGRDDIVGRVSEGWASGQWWAAISNPDGTVTNKKLTAWNEANQWRDVKIADINGDGLDDVVGRIGTSNSHQGEWWSAISSVNGTSINKKLTTWNEANNWIDVQIADINGDGQDDIVGRVSEGWARGQWWAAVSNFDGTVTNQKLTTWNESNEWRDVQIADINGDGRDDIVGRVSEGWARGQWWAATAKTGGSFYNQRITQWNEANDWAGIRIADINGDGRDDIVGRISAGNNYQGEWWGAISNADGTVTNKKLTSWNEFNNWTDIRIADVNGDGRDDIVGRISASNNRQGEWWAAISNPDGTVTNKRLTQWNEANEWRDIRIADFEGDGRDDIVARASTGPAQGQWWSANSLNDKPIKELPEVSSVYAETVREYLGTDYLYNPGESNYPISDGLAVPELNLISSTHSANPDYQLQYKIDDVLHTESLLLHEGENYIVREAVSVLGNIARETFVVTLESEPPQIEQFVINYEAEETRFDHVALNILAYDLGSIVTEMIFSNDGINYSTPEPYQTTKTWALDSLTPGEKAVWVRVKDSTGKWSEAVSASIYYAKPFVLEDFDTESRINTFWDLDGPLVYQRPAAYGTGYDGDYSMHINFQKKPDYEYSLFAFEPAQDGEGNNFSDYKSLRFHLKKEHPEPMVLLMKLEFNNTSETAEFQIQFPQGTTDWEEVAFNFTNIPTERLSNVKNVLFFVDPGRADTAGSFYIDRIFLDETQSPKLIDDFEGNSSVATYWDRDDQLIYQRQVIEEEAYEGTYSMRVDYGKQEGFPYGFFGLEIEQDGYANNFSGYGSLEFHVNKIHQEPMVILIKMEFNDTSDAIEKEFYFTEGKNEWKKIAFDFLGISESNLASVKNIQFFADPTSESTSGAFYLDSIRLAEKPTVRILDDFEGNDSLIETYWDIDGSGTVYTRTIDNTEGADGTHAMRVLYNKSEEYSASSFAIRPIQNGLANNFSEFNALKMYLKKTTAQAMDLMMKLEFEGTQINFEVRREIVKDTDEWQEVIFDFSTVDKDLLKNVKSILFFVDPIIYGEAITTQGEFLIDSLQLIYDPELPSRQFTNQAPELGWAGSFVGPDSDNKYQAGSLVRIDLWEGNAAEDLQNAIIRIRSEKTGYDSGIKEVLFTHDGQFWPFHWDTMGLEPSDDYSVEITLRDKVGNVSTDSDLIINLVGGVPPIGTTVTGIDSRSFMNSNAEFSLIRNYELRDGWIFDHQMGDGWHSSVDSFVQSFPDGTISLHLGENGYFFYSRDNNGNYTSHQKPDASQLEKLDQGFKLTLIDGAEYLFNSALFDDYNTGSQTWYLSTITDSNQRVTQFIYDTYRNPIKIILPSGSEYILGYSLREIDQFGTNKFNLDTIQDPLGNIWHYQHDDEGNLIAVIDPVGNSTRYEYASGGRLTKIINPENAVIERIYDSEGRLVEIKRNGRSEQKYTYSNDNLKVVIEDALGGKTAQEYSWNGLLTKEIDTLGYVTLFKYDENFFPEEIIDKNGQKTIYEYNDYGEIVSATNPAGETSRYTYDPIFHKVISAEEASGNTVNYDYDERGNLIKTYDVLGVILNYTYDSNGNILTEKDALGNTITNTYNEKGLLVSRADSLGFITGFQYDALGRLIRQIQPNGGVISNQYDSIGNLIQTIDSLGNVTQYKYDSMNRLIKKNDALGGVYEYQYDINGNLLLERDEGGNAKQYSYDAIGNVTSQMDALWNKTIFEYNQQSNLVSAIDPMGRITSYTHSITGNLLLVSDALGRETQNQYDELNRLIEKAIPSGGSVNFEYDEAGKLIVKTNPKNNSTQYNYDIRGRLISEVDALGRITAYTHDDINQITQIADSLGQTTRFEYDPAGRLLKVIYPDNSEIVFQYDSMGNAITFTDEIGRTLDFAYDSAGNLTSKTDPEGNATQYTYDSLNRLIQIIDALGNATRFSYDARGNMIEIADSLGNTTSYTYDELNRIAQTSYPDGSRELFRYDKAGNLIYYMNRKGEETSNFYDAGNRLIRRRLPNGVMENFQYDDMDNLITIESDNSLIRRAFDQLGRLVQEVDGWGNLINYSYDELGNLTFLSTYLDGVALIRRYAYDDLNRLIQIEDENGHITSYGYDSRSRVNEKILPNLTSTEYTYNTASELTDLAHIAPAGDSFRTFSFQYDERGLITEKTDSFEGASSFEFDELGRLVSVTNPLLGVMSFLLDELGNRERVTASEEIESYINNNLNQTTKRGSLDYVYDDDNGNLLQEINGETGDVTTYTYNDKNQLIKVTLSDGATVTYRYDVLGRRIEKKTPEQTIHYHWIGSEVIAETNGKGELLKSFVYGRDVDEVLYEVDRVTSDVFYYHADQINSTIAITDGSGDLVESYVYDSYGKLLYAKDHANNSIETPRINRLYTGREYDSETGQYYNRLRYYSLDLGKFTTADPIGYEAGLNLYNYVLNNPLQSRDPMGTDTYYGGGAPPSYPFGFGDDFDLEGRGVIGNFTCSSCFPSLTGEGGNLGNGGFTYSPPPPSSNPGSFGGNLYNPTPGFGNPNNLDNGGSRNLQNSTPFKRDPGIPLPLTRTNPEDNVIWFKQSNTHRIIMEVPIPILTSKKVLKDLSLTLKLQFLLPSSLQGALIAGPISSGPTINSLRYQIFGWEGNIPDSPFLKFNLKDFWSPGSLPETKIESV